MPIAVNLLVEQHGQDTTLEATVLDKGDLDGYAVWKHIIKAVEELLTKERPAGVTVQ